MQSRLEQILFYALLLFLPTQLGKHFWPDFSLVSGIRIDYLSPTLYFTDILLLLLFLTVFVTHEKKFVFDLPSRTTILVLGGFLFLLTNIIFSLNPLNGLYALLKLAEMVFFGWYISRTTQTTRQVMVIFISLSFGVLGEAVLAFAQFLNHGSIGGPLYLLGERLFSAQTPGIANASINGELILRPYGTFSHPNVLAGF